MYLEADIDNMLIHKVKSDWELDNAYIHAQKEFQFSESSVFFGDSQKFLLLLFIYYFFRIIS